MASDMQRAQYSAQLGFVKQYLDERGWSSELVEQDGERPVSVLVVAAPPDRHGRERSIAVAYVPLDEDDLEHISLLQFYAPLPFKLDAQRAADVDALLRVINTALPMGNFSHKDDGELFLKYVYTVPLFEMVDTDQFLEVFMLFWGMLETFSDAIEGVSSGRMPLAETLSTLQVAPIEISAGAAEPATILDTVKAYLEATGASYSGVGDSGLVIEVEGDNASYTCFIMARERDKQLIFYTSCPIEIPDDKTRDVVEYITRANYGLYLGNFEIDLDDNDLRFKTSIGVEGDVLAAALISQVIYPNVATMDRYFPGLRAIVAEGLSAVEAIQQIEG